MDVKDGEICIMELGNWALAFFSLTLTTNGLCTLLIAVRILVLRKNQKIIDSWTNRFSRLVLSVVSSGLTLIYYGHTTYFSATGRSQRSYLHNSSSHHDWDICIEEQCTIHCPRCTAADHRHSGRSIASLQNWTYCANSLD